MNSDDYRRALENMHNLVDDLEDVTIENKVLTHENKELEKDVQFIAKKHNDTIHELKELANGTREYRVGRALRNEEPQKIVMHEGNENPDHKLNDSNITKLFDRFSEKLNMFKWKAIFVIALILVVMLAVGASPANVLSWTAFTDLYIEFICNPATMAMAVTLVVLLYKGIIKKHKK